MKYSHSKCFLTHPADLFFKYWHAQPETVSSGKFDWGSSHLSKSNAGVSWLAQAEQKSAIEQNGKSWLSWSLWFSASDHCKIATSHN